MTKLVSIADCTKLLAEAGDVVTPQGLGKYVRKHRLQRDKVGRAVMVDPAEVAERRKDFTREKMRGEHSTKSKSEPKPQLATNQTETPTSLDAARLAKARREEAQAESAEFDLYQKTKDGLGTADVEVMIGLLLTLTKETLLGARLEDDAQRSATAANLPDTLVPTIKSVMKQTRRDTLGAMGDSALKQLRALDPIHADGLPERLEQIREQTQALRETQRDQQQSRLRATARSEMTSA